MRKAGRKLWFVVLVAMMGIQFSGAAVFEGKAGEPARDASAAAWAGDAAAEFFGWGLDHGR